MRCAPREKFTRAGKKKTFKKSRDSKENASKIWKKKSKEKKDSPSQKKSDQFRYLLQKNGKRKTNFSCTISTDFIFSNILKLNLVNPIDIIANPKSIIHKVYLG